jgi:hypothetical protein
VYSNDVQAVTQGSRLQVKATLRDQLGQPLAGYDGTETLAAVVWPGGDRAASFDATATWVDAPAAAVLVTMSAAETAALDPGRYELLVRVQAPGQDPDDAYGCAVDIIGAPGTGAAPKVYCNYAHLLRFGRSWLRQLQTDDDEAGFAEQLGRARTWIEDLAHAHYRVASMAMVVGHQAMGPRRSGARSPWLQAQLAADTLIVTDQVREAAAKKALAYICDGQIGVGDAAVQYARLAKFYHSEADYIGSCLTLELDTDGDGYSDVTIDCTSTDPFYG